MKMDLKLEKSDITKMLGLSINLDKLAEWTQDYVLEDRIIDGVLVVKDGRKKRYIKIMEIEAVNMDILTAQEQDMVIDEYADFLKMGPKNFQIKIVTTETDVTEYIKAAEIAYMEEENEGCKDLIANYVSSLRGEGGVDNFKKHYYFIFEYEPPEGSKAKSEEEKIQYVNMKAEELASEFTSMGNEIIPFSVDGNMDSEIIELSELLYKYYNRRTSFSESYDQRTTRHIMDAKKVNNVSKVSELPPINFKDIIAPKSIDFNESPNYMVIDGMYRAHFIVKGNSIPTNMCTLNNWLKSLQTLGYGYDIDIFYKKQDATEKLNKIRTGIRLAKIQNFNAREEDANFGKVQEGYRGNMFMKVALSDWGEELYNMTALITIYAFTLDELSKRIAELKKLETRAGIKIIPAKRFQEEAFKSTGYTHNLLPKIENIGRRNVTTQGVAAAYPYISYSMMDKQGVAIGSALSNNALIMYDPHDRKYANSNIAIYGQSGYGKTYTLLTLTTRLRYLGDQIFIISPIKQHEFIKTCTAVGGSFIDLSSSSKYRINALDIIPLDSPTAELLEEDGYQERDWLTDKIVNLKTWLKHLIPSLSEKTAKSQARLVALENILIELYGEFGITTDNDSVWEDEDSKKLKEMPILSDFYEKVKTQFGEEDDITVILSQFVFGAARSLNGQTNVDLNNKYTVFGVEYIEEDLLAPTMFIILDYIWSKCREDRTSKKMVVIDEGWKMFRGSHGEVGEFVEEIFKTIRGFGGGAIFATQQITDLYANGNDYGNAILANANSKIVLHCEKTELDLITDKLGLTVEERNKILKFKEKGQALFCAASNHIPIKIKATEAEHEMFTTDRNDLANMVERKQKNLEESEE